MSKGPSRFKLNDIKRGHRALESLGVKVARVEIDKAGKIIFVAAGADEAREPVTANEWDGAE